ncbi:MAG TPA: outer membrane beta-barrel protein [Gemmatimonadaceae bacterium]
MKHVVISSTVAALAALSAVSTAHAQTTIGTEAYPLGFGIAAGATIPMGNLGDVQSTGWNILGLVDYTTPHTPLGFRADIAYNSLSGKTFTLPGQPAFKTDNQNVWQITGDAVWHFRPADTTATSHPVTPYIIGGVGLYHFGGVTTTDVTTGAQSSSGSSTKFGLNIGGGVNFQLSGFATFAEARFHNVFATGGSLKYFPISFGVRFGGP